MLPDRVSNPGHLTYESGALPIALRGPAGKRGEKRKKRVEMSKQPQPAPSASAVGPCPTVIRIEGRPGTGSLPSTIAPPDHPRHTIIQFSRTPLHWKFTQHRRKTRSPPGHSVFNWWFSFAPGFQWSCVVLLPGMSRSHNTLFLSSPPL